MTESLIGFAVLLLLIFLKMPVAFAMALVGLVGFALMRGLDAALAMTGTLVFDAGLAYSLSVVPLFIFMGNVLARSGISHGLYAVANHATARMRGGLAMASVIACGGFSAVCGSSLATAATMSKVAMPSMRRYGYADSLAAGSIAAGGTLGILIPPSVILIIYGLLTESDIGKLFIAGIVPGLLGLVLYLAAVQVAVWRNPSLAPPAEELDPLTRRDGLGVAALVILFAIIMVGIYGGFFTPTEAAGIGAGASLPLAALFGRLGWRPLMGAIGESARATAMIFVLIIGADIFTNFINFAGLPDALSGFVYDLEVNAWLVIAAIVVVYLILGCVLESLSMILLTVPVFYPLVSELDFGTGLLADPELVLIWFAIVVVVVTEISLITPPVGLNVFVLRSVLEDVSLATIFKGVTPFWIADIVRLGLLIGCPVLSLWLVGAMR
ncbi:TRAP transporter large permease [Stappia taiwanensis]|uniref:TRAP transporter large permease protein n=1 Tax=Stappia taiwanensis TaxID=992267 RepID=A0A838XQQ9_9HYPH|nr:TRAP transporter large permease [Stappia taiwanensis]MBA4611381.1 TRAP transporter large permease [Stappia taiwanensis]GGF00771.1 C4-dicarboxylate ABC transporter permease [Stappia taiwanensis]